MEEPRPYEELTQSDLAALAGVTRKSVNASPSEGRSTRAEASYCVVLSLDDINFILYRAVILQYSTKI